jgi:hypothetical protein
MDLLYYFNGKNSGYTWKQLLYSLRNAIDQKSSFFGKKLGWSYYYKINDANLHNRINSYFNTYVHNENDGGYWVQGKYERIIIGIDENNQRIEVNGDWIPPHWKANTNGWYIKDSLGRIIPSGYLKVCVRKYIINEEDCKPIERKYGKGYGRYWWYNSYDHDRDFRKGPVPGIRSYSRGHWHKYAGKHGGYVGEMRTIHGDLVDVKEVFEEFGVRYKINTQRLYDLDPWGPREGKYGSGNKGYGWKRTRKRKQWMKNVHLDTCLELTGVEM